MQIDNHLNNNELYFSLQEKIVKFLLTVPYASWDRLRNIAVSLHQGLSDDERSTMGDNPEYKLIYPLLRIGIIEVARNQITNKCVYCIGPKKEITLKDKQQIIFDPENYFNKINLIHNTELSFTTATPMNDCHILIKKIPSLLSVISNWDKSEIEPRYIYDHYNKEHFSNIKQSMSCAIYAIDNQVYSNKYIKTDSGSLYRIPYRDMDIDAINIALSYIRSMEGKKTFIYNKNKKILNCFTFKTILPIVICRILFLCDPTCFLKDESYMYLNPEFNNISIEIVKELRRIFGKVAVEEIND